LTIIGESIVNVVKVSLQRQLVVCNKQPAKRWNLFIFDMVKLKK